jgi:hypothetical protein
MCSIGLSDSQRTHKGSRTLVEILRITETIPP